LFRFDYVSARSSGKQGVSRQQKSIVHTIAEKIRGGVCATAPTRRTRFYLSQSAFPVAHLSRLAVAHNPLIYQLFQRRDDAVQNREESVQHVNEPDDTDREDPKQYLLGDDEAVQQHEHREDSEQPDSYGPNDGGHTRMSTQTVEESLRRHRDPFAALTRHGDIVARERIYDRHVLVGQSRAVALELRAPRSSKEYVSRRGQHPVIATIGSYFSLSKSVPADERTV